MIQYSPEPRPDGQMPAADHLLPDTNVMVRHIVSTGSQNETNSDSDANIDALRAVAASSAKVTILEVQGERVQYHVLLQHALDNFRAMAKSVKLI